MIISSETRPTVSHASYLYISTVSQPVEPLDPLCKLRHSNMHPGALRVQLVEASHAGIFDCFAEWREGDDAPPIVLCARHMAHSCHRCRARHPSSERGGCACTASEVLSSLQQGAPRKSFRLCSRPAYQKHRLRLPLNAPSCRQMLSQLMLHWNAP